MATSLLKDEQYQQLERRLRIMLQDYPEANKLVGEEIFSPERIEVAVEDALDDWNATPPIIATVTFHNHPMRSLLARRIFIELLRHQYYRLTSDGVDFNDGGAAITDSSKASLLLNLSNTLNSEYQNQKQSIKVAINIQGAWGNVPGDYYNSLGYGYAY